MTRETKIGLLVGLAFIITVGILLSNYMADKTELAPAPLEIAAQTAHNAVVPPGERNLPSISRVIVPNDVTPGPIPTRDELTIRQPIGEIKVGAPAANPTDAQPRDNNATIASNVHAPLPPNVNDLAEAARLHGESLVDPRHPAGGDLLNDQTAPLRPAAPKAYVAQAGDNLNKIAAKTLGASTKATRDAILKANPKLAANPDRIIVGQSYVIPSLTKAPEVAPAAPTGTAILKLPTPAPADRAAATDRTARAVSTNIYIVKDGDNSLWGIAREQLGTPQAVAAIKELNKEVLKGGDVIRVGMRLKMPAKSVAMAN